MTNIFFVRFGVIGPPSGHRAWRLVEANIDIRERENYHRLVAKDGVSSTSSNNANDDPLVHRYKIFK